MSKKSLDDQIEITKAQVYELNAKLKSLQKKKADQDYEKQLATAKRIVGLMKEKNIVPDEKVIDKVLSEISLEKCPKTIL